jgi:heme-degrading monooxygenase HmoA
MRFLTATECRVPLARMKEFTNLVQQWEQRAVGVEGGPSLHAVYLHHHAPERVLVVTQFDSVDDARAFVAAGMLSDFHTKVLACVEAPTEALDGWDLFYAAGSDGRRVMFGESR